MIDFIKVYPKVCMLETMVFDYDLIEKICKWRDEIVLYEFGEGINLINFKNVFPIYIISPNVHFSYDKCFRYNLGTLDVFRLLSKTSEY